MNQSSRIRDGDSLLDEFFTEIEKLTIKDENDDGEEAFMKEGRRTVTSTPTQKGIRHKTPSPKKHEDQKLMLDRAETTRNNWKKFVIEEASSLTSPTSIGATGRKSISFSIGASTTAKKKKKNSKSQSKASRHHRHENRPQAISLAFSDETTTSQTPTARKSPVSHGHACLLPPQWIAVLDTCALLESYQSVCDMIKLAKDTAAFAEGTLDASFFEALTVVVPYTVWDELDYRSKVISDEEQRYKARRATRILSDELRLQDNKQHLFGFAAKKSDVSIISSIRSQSRIESHQAIEKFILLSTASNDKILANDDKILACALWEQDQLAKARAHATTLYKHTTAAGGVVLITFDKVLTGKARADHISVYSPVDFIRYYNKRMASLKSRASGPTGRGSSNKT